MKKELVIKLHNKFEQVVNHEEQVEFWFARDLQQLLGYEKWENFIKVVEKGKIACSNSKQKVTDHFLDVRKMVVIGSSTKREVEDIKLTRYACYLIAQNGDSKKTEIAFAQTYFAVQTRKQEIIEQRLFEMERIQAREKLSKSEKQLSSILFERGIDNHGFARIRSKGDEALFGGKNTQQMKNKLNVPDNRALADFLPTITVKAKDFANEITNFSIIRDDLKDEKNILREHTKNNSNVRKALVDRDIYPENLPPAEDIKKIKRKVRSENKNLAKTTKKL